MNENNYREKYKRYYGIEFGKDFVIHHIDFDRENNDISNLVLLPRELHEWYHAIINAISVSVDKPKADGIIDVRLSNDIVTDYCATVFDRLPAVMAECAKWIRLKRSSYRYVDLPEGITITGR